MSYAAFKNSTEDEQLGFLDVWQIDNQGTGSYSEKLDSGQFRTLII